MKTKISFHNMPHSEALEQHSLHKLKKIDAFFKHDDHGPLHTELWLKANKIHPHHAVELHLKTPHFDLNTHGEGTDMYIVIDETIEKMVGLLAKEKDKLKTKKRHTINEKKLFLKD